MNKLWICIFLLILISNVSAEQIYDSKALNYDSYIQTTTICITILFGILALGIGFIGFFQWKFFDKMIQDRVKEECKQDNLDLREHIKKLEDRINSIEKDQKNGGADYSLKKIKKILLIKNDTELL